MTRLVLVALLAACAPHGTAMRGAAAAAPRATPSVTLDAAWKAGFRAALDQVYRSGPDCHAFSGGTVCFVSGGPTCDAYPGDEYAVCNWANPHVVIPESPWSPGVALWSATPRPRPHPSPPASDDARHRTFWHATLDDEHYEPQQMPSRP